MAELRKISQDELKKILEDHWTWVESKGKEGGRANLGGANLQKADLRSANLQEAGLFLANLQEAKLRSANLQETDLYLANLQEAKLRSANLQKADLRSANLQEADLFGANLQKAKLRSANLQEAYLHGTEGLTASQVKDARNYKLAYYDDEFLKKYGKELGLPQSNKEHTANVRKKLAELEKKKKEATTKK